MLTLYERLSRIVEVLPDDTAVTLPVHRVREWLADEGDRPHREANSTFEPDLTVEEIAEKLGKGASTVRAWFNAGIEGAYKLNGKEWRISAADFQRFMRGAPSQPATLSTAPKRGTRMTDWKR